MMGSRTQKILVVGFIIAVISIPAGSLLLNQRLKVEKNLQNYDRTVTTPSLNEVPKKLPSPTPSPSTSSDSSLGQPTNSAQLSYGPNLNFSVSLEGRPQNSQGGRFFVGISQGQVSSNPTYLLTFNVDVPASGQSNTISLVGLNIGSSYTAYIKGPAQLAKGSTFTMSPNGATIPTLNITTGDLNEDNVIDISDYNIAKGLLGTTPDSSNWNSNADFNQDGIVNSLDLEVIKKNLGKVGDGGAWYSKAPVASKSADLINPLNIGGERLSPGGKQGYWMWVPSLP